MKCKCGCGKEVPEAVGKKPRLFYSDACRKRYKRTQETDTATNGQEETDTEQMSIIDGDILDMMPRLLCPGPLDVYSEQRWAFLQSRGHVWDADRQRSTRPGPHGTQIVGVTVPGDPAYEGSAA